MLAFIASTKIKVHNIWDVLFALIAMIVYALFFQTWSARLFVGKWIFISLFALIFAAGLFVLVWSISFWLQRGSKVRDLFQSFFIVFGSYPPTIFQQKKLIFILVSMVGLYPGVFLPYQMMTGNPNIQNRLVLILASVAMFIFWIFVFYRWLRRYSSWNLVHQM